MNNNGTFDNTNGTFINYETFVGDGTFIGHLDNAGVLAPGNSAGALIGGTDITGIVVDPEGWILLTDGLLAMPEPSSQLLLVLPVGCAGQKLPQLHLNDLCHCLDWWLVVGADTSSIHISP